MAPGVAGGGNRATAKVLAALAPQVLSAVTSISPELLPKVTVMDVVPAPAVMLAPEGTVHEYEVAVGTEAIVETAPVSPSQNVAGPVMAPGAPGISFTSTDVETGVASQPLTDRLSV